MERERLIGLGEAGVFCDTTIYCPRKLNVGDSSSLVDEE